MTQNYWKVCFIAFMAFSLLAIFMPSADFAFSDPNIDKADLAWMLTASALVLLMTPGLSFFYGGMVNSKSIISTMLQSFICMGLISLVWVAIGFSLAFGDSIFGLIGNPFSFLMFKEVGAATNSSLSPTIPLALFALFQMKFAIITPALITGSLAERVRFSAYMLFVVLFTLCVYCPLAHWTWHPQGFLRAWGVLDFAGGAVVHMSAGFAALAGALALGKRVGIASHSQPANIPFVLLGTGMLWFGWFGFNAGSALGANQAAVQAFLTTNSACAAAMLTWIMFDGMLGRKPSAMGACIAAVVGLVAITPAAGFVSLGSSIFIGAVSAVVSNVAVYWKSKSSIDDTLDVFPCHGLGGICGMLLTAVLATNGGLITGETSLIFKHIAALLIVASFTFTASYLLFLVVNKIIPLRVTKAEELSGLDISQHNETIVNFEKSEIVEVQLGKAA